MSLNHHGIVSLLGLENEVCKIAEHGIDVSLESKLFLHSVGPWPPTHLIVSSRISMKKV